MTTELDTPEALATKALAGDRAALEALCRALQGPIYRLALRIVGRAADAEDATQEILLKVVTHLSTFRGESQLVSWAYTIATRHLLRVRASEREARASTTEDLAALIDAGLGATRPDDVPEGEVALLARDVQRTCAQAMLLALSREERLAIVLVEMLGASDAVAAEMCGATPAAFRQRLSRARGKLAPLLEQRCGIVRGDDHCSCTRQAVAKQRAGLRLPIYDDANEPLRRAYDDLGEIARLRGLLAVDPAPAPRRELWTSLVLRWPTILG